LRKRRDEPLPRKINARQRPARVLSGRVTAVALSVPIILAIAFLVLPRSRASQAKAIASWKKAVELDATNYDALYNLATTLARDGRMAEARPYLERFVRTAPPAFYEKDIREVSAILARGGK
jgi:tetratricopeptide (TPR) repeat protein